MASNSDEGWTKVVKQKQKRTQDKPTTTLSPVRNTKQNLPLQSIISRPILKQTNHISSDTKREYTSHVRNFSPPRRYDYTYYTEGRRENGQTASGGDMGSGRYFERRTESSGRKESQKFPKGETGFTRRPGVIALPQKLNKPKKSKKKKTDSHYLRSVNEVSLNLSDVLKVVPANKTKISTGVSVVPIRSRTLINTKSQMTPRNVLDSTAPLVLRGKERITPKNKKPTKLKRLVLEERRLIKLQKDLKRQPNYEDTQLPNLILPVIRISFIDSDLNEHEATPEYTDSLTIIISDAIKSEGIREHKDETTPQDDAILNNIQDKQLSDNEDSIEKEEVVSKPETSKLEITTFEFSFIGEGLPGLHTKKFREYCNQMPDKKVDELTNKLLYELMKLQARQHDMNKIKSKGKKRLVFGFHEVTKHLRVENLKCIVIARDLERSRAVGGLEHQITTICKQCSAQNIQVIFALTKHSLSFSVCKPKTIVSIVGILNYDGRQEIYKELLKLVIVKQKEYSEVVREKKNKLQTVHDGDGCEVKIEEIPNEDPESVVPDKLKDSNKNSSCNRPNSVAPEHRVIQLKKFELKDIEITEFVPQSFNPTAYPYSGLYSSQYIQHYNYPPYSAIYPPYYFYPAYSQYSQYDQ